MYGKLSDSAESFRNKQNSVLFHFAITRNECMPVYAYQSPPLHKETVPRSLRRHSEWSLFASVCQLREAFFGKKRGLSGELMSRHGT